jgi:hypothetical protein
VSAFPRADNTIYTDYNALPASSAGFDFVFSLRDFYPSYPSLMFVLAALVVPADCGLAPVAAMHGIVIPSASGQFIQSLLLLLLLRRWWFESLHEAILHQLCHHGLQTARLTVSAAGLHGDSQAQAYCTASMPAGPILNWQRCIDVAHMFGGRHEQRL